MAYVYNMDLVPSSAAITGLDYFILASGSDVRAYEVLSKIDFTAAAAPKVILFHFNERLEHKDPSDPLFRYTNLGIPKLQEITCEIRNPGSSLTELERNDFNDSKAAGIDISCFTKPYFYFVLKLLRERFGLSKLTAFYTEPQSYYFPKGVFTDFHSSTGPLSILEIPGYPGEEPRDAFRKLIILLGFDGDLSREINEDVSPGETIVINGFPSYSPKFKDISLIANEKLVSNENVRVEYARANHPFEVYNLLEAIKGESLKTKGNGAPFLNIAPLGTKPMALGACLFALHNPEVRVVYPVPEHYEDKYSDECWHSWAYELPLVL